MIQLSNRIVTLFLSIAFSFFSIAKDESPIAIVFVREGCIHCAHAEKWIQDIRFKKPGISIQVIDITKSPEALIQFQAAVDLHKIETPAVPLFIVGNKYLLGFDEKRSGEELSKLLGIDNEALLPGWISLERLGLPTFTILVGLVDGFNPCAMWVLIFLLSMLVHVKSRKRMLLISSIFVLVSGLVYLTFMAAWFNIFQAIGLSTAIRWIVGSVGIFMALLHLRDYFWGFSSTSLILSDSAKSKVAARIRDIVTAENLPLAIVSVAVLAILVNFYELLCTAGLPALYVQILMQQKLSLASYYGYLVLYNFAYLFDDGLMVFTAVWAMSNRRLKEDRGRVLKLISGVLLLGLSLAILFWPKLLQFE